MSSISITNASRAEHVGHLSRLLARRVALGLALYRADMKAAARAAGRIRLPELGISKEEENAARFARATLGRAIRDARARALRAPIVRPAFEREEIVAPARSRRRLAVFTSLAAALAVVIVILLLGQPGGPLSATRAPGAVGSGSQQVLDPTKDSRGRTGNFTQKVAVGKPVATSAPGSPNPADVFDREDRGGGGGGGSGSGGSGTGGVGVVPLPPAVPGPTPIPSGYVRFHGRVFDAVTGSPLPGVCIVIGSLDCAADKPHSDALGYWEATVTMQPYWDFGWQKVGYAARLERLYSFGQNDVGVQDIRLNH